VPDAPYVAADMHYVALLQEFSWQRSSSDLTDIWAVIVLM
jgi:hypothetical protein